MDFYTKIEPRHTALLVIDLQKDFAAPDGLRGRKGGDLSHIELLVNNLQTLIPTAQKAGVLTLYTQQIYDRTKLNELQKEQFDLDGKVVTCDPSTGGHDFYKIQPPPELVYEKYNFNAFSNPQLAETLKAHNIKTLVIAGMDTYYCVETAIRNGFDLGYKIVVPEDLVAGSSRHMDFHNRTLQLVKKTYGIVTTSHRLAEAWKT